MLPPEDIVHDCDHCVFVTADDCEERQKHEANSLRLELRILELQILAVKDATTLAKKELDLRLEGMNEFRSQLKDQAAGLTPMIAFNAHVKQADEELKLLRIEDEKIRGSLTTLIASFNTASNGLEKRLESMNEFRSQLKDQAAGFFTRNEHIQFENKVNEDIRVLRESRAELAGKASQKSMNLTLALAIVSLVISAMGTVIALLHGFSH